MNSLTKELITQEVTEAATAAGVTIKLAYSEQEESPRKFFEVSSKLVTGDRGRLSNMADIKMPRDLCGDSLKRNITNYSRAAGVPKSDMLVWGVYTHEHGKIALSISPYSCSFDGQCSGFIYESRKELYAEFGVKRITKAIQDKIEGRIRAELNELEQWANGEIAELIIEKDGEEVMWRSSIYSPNVTDVTEMALELIHEYKTGQLAA